MLLAVVCFRLGPIADVFPEVQCSGGRGMLGYRWAPQVLSAGRPAADVAQRYQAEGRPVPANCVDCAVFGWLVGNACGVPLQMG